MLSFSWAGSELQVSHLEPRSAIDPCSVGWFKGIPEHFGIDSKQRPFDAGKVAFSVTNHPPWPFEEGV
jgi:hypothetical protein